MELEDQVVSLELAKKLKELGVKQESLCYWYIRDDNSEYLEVGESSECLYYVDKDDSYSAFTVAELGELIGQLGNTWKLEGEWGIYSDINDVENSIEHIGEKFFSKKEVDARAKLLIHLIKEGIIKTK